MTASEAILVANELKHLGFDTKIVAGNSVKVSLNRPIGIDEVQVDLENAAGPNDFLFRKSGNGVIVK